MDKNQEEYFSYLKSNFNGDYFQNEPLSLHTWYEVGGPADYLLYPSNNYQLTELLKISNLLKIDTFVIGEGANLLVCDKGFRGTIIKLSKHFRNISIQDEYVTCDAGVILSDLILYCETKSMGGLEYLSGIPGTVGGALIMNAGTHDAEICNCVEEVYLMNEMLETIKLKKNQIDFGYRSAPQLQNTVITGCKLKLSYKSERKLKKIRTTQLKRRASKQPLNYPSCGSVFKRPANNYVGKMVEDLGLKGLRHGKAMISDKHGGFIVNTGGAKADDIVYLIKVIEEKVFDNYSINLEREVKLLGFQ